MLLLCSNGLTSDKLINYVKQQNGWTSAVVVTANPEYKKNNYHISRSVEELKQCGLSLDLFDIDFQSVNKLLDYDVVMFIGGNPLLFTSNVKKKQC